MGVAASTKIFTPARQAEKSRTARWCVSGAAHAESRSIWLFGLASESLPARCPIDGVEWFTIKSDDYARLFALEKSLPSG